MMETLSNRTVPPLFTWRPAKPEPMEKFEAVGAITWVPLIERDKVAVVPEPATWNRTVYQVPAVMVKLAVATFWKVAVPLL